MPELPEVETIRRQLEPKLVGKRFDRVEILDSRLVRPLEPLEVSAELEGERVAAVERRGKYLIVRFESDRVLLIHLRMTGSLRHVVGGSLQDDPHRRAVVRLDDGSDVTYRDVRRFGTWVVVEPPEVGPYLSSRLGPEPLDRAFGARQLGERLAGRRAPIKAALLDQRTVAGLGNIYVDEALWRSQIHPLTAAAAVGEDDVRALTRAIKDVLRAAIERRGATLRDYSQPDGSRGRAQRAFRVYGRAGESCDRCGTPIEKIRAGGRGTWFCPHCQVRGEL
jgi:formamidopyrimidine-DNA glycosylase